MTSIPIRPATVTDIPFLWDMLFESVFVSDDERTALRRDPEPPPELSRYLEAWGRPGDAGVVAQDTAGIPVGAAWYRLYGPLDRGNGILAHPGVPELAIAVEREHRGRGIGGDLLEALARTARDDGYERLMLSVDPENARAVHLYDRMGFELLDTDAPARGTSLIMQLFL